MIKLIKVLVLLVAVFLILSFLLDKSETGINYGVSFSKFHAEELKLDWKETYLAILDDLKVRNFRFSAHWPDTEPQEGVFNFSVLDFQMKEAKEHDASVIFAIGRRLPGWPECHDPQWLEGKDAQYRNEKLLDYIETVVNRYKKFDNITHWQVENEPFLGFFANFYCGSLDEVFLKQEIELVKKLDPSRPVLVTDSGEFGTWYKAYRSGDAFGTSLYLYVWNKYVGPMRYPITPLFFRLKHSLITLIYGDKPSFLVELSMEPWLLMPIIDTPVPVLLERMGIDKFNRMIDFSSRTGFHEQYLWGAEWWYWMKQTQSHPEFWDRAKRLFNQTSLTTK